VALANYARVVRDPLVWSALGRTLLYALYVPVSMALALVLALMIGGRRRSSTEAPALRALFLLPYASSGGRGRSRVAVDVPPRFRVAQSPADTRRSRRR